MDLDAIRQWALAFIEAHKAWTPLIAGVLAFCESVAFLSFLVPATVILLALGPMIAAADVSFWPVVLCAAIGAALGDWLSYEFGHYFKGDAKRMWPMRRYPAAVARAEAFCRRWGAGAVALGRFFGPIRAVIPLVAGVFGVRRVPFQVANIASALAWAFILIAPGAGLMTWWRG
ncbi:DedA family protein [Methylorubrum extorquens]